MTLKEASFKVFEDILKTGFIPKLGNAHNKSWAKKESVYIAKEFSAIRQKTVRDFSNPDMRARKEDWKRSSFLAIIWLDSLHCTNPQIKKVLANLEKMNPKKYGKK